MTRLSRRLLIALALCAPAATLLAQRGTHHDMSSEARLYKARFAQQSVLRVDEPVCASF
jgi:hypothetical protein